MGSLSEEVCICTSCPPVGLPVGGFIFETFSAEDTSILPVLATTSSSDGTWSVMEVSEDAVLGPDITESV
jgi:hypothetical protein